MNDFLIFAGLLIVWMVVQCVILPRMGVPT
jgi:hypothetical protein